MKTLTVRPGNIPGVGSLFVTIEWDGLKLSITGVSGPMENGDARGSCGQCQDELNEVTIFADGWDAAKCARLKEIWDRWHLNGMRAGSPMQQSFLRANPVTAVYPESYYEKACAALADAGLNPDNGYRYGSAWKTEEVPAVIIDELFALPVADRPMPRLWQ